MTFNLPNPLFIDSAFLDLMVSAVSGCEGGPTVAWCERLGESTS